MTVRTISHSARLFACVRALTLAGLLPWARAASADNDFLPNFAGADVNIGERLFLETRFSQYFFTNSGGDANAMIPGDPTVTQLLTTTGHVAGPFSGQAMNCRQCHLVDEKGYGDFGDHTLGNRTYADFARRSPIPLRDDGRANTTRNAQPLVDALLPRDVPLFLHHDGQFASVHDLIIGTLTGRNYGWKPSEYATAVHHIASIIRNDDGMGYLATLARGGRFMVEMPGYAAYANVFSGFTDYQGSYILDPRALVYDLISPEYCIDMRGDNSSDEEILNAIATLVEAYLRNLTFSQATNGVDFFGFGTPIFNGSPFDLFLIKNRLPQSPDQGETPLRYAQRLLHLLTRLPNPQYIADPADGHFDTHTQKFRFGPTELAGLKLFLTGKDTPGKAANASSGNCAVCHSLPAFTDFIFHNTGVAQQEYDEIHGAGSFKKLKVPGLVTRALNYDAFLPPTPQHPNASGVFESIPSCAQPGATDLGLWNVYANPDFAAPQAGLAQILPRLLGMTTPAISSVRIQDRHFLLSGSNAVPGSVFYLMTSENPTAPPTAWTAIVTNTFDSCGRFNLALPISPGLPRGFFRLALRMPTPAEVLPLTLARFKTPTLRDLSHSGPYLHTGKMNTIEGVLLFYQQFSLKARRGEVRNADPELSNIFLSNHDIAPLAAFIRSLNEDYTD